MAMKHPVYKDVHFYLGLDFDGVHDLQQKIMRVLRCSLANMMK